MQNQSTKIQTVYLLWSLYLFTGYGRNPITLDCALTSPAILTCLNHHELSFVFVDVDWISILWFWCSQIPFLERIFGTYFCASWHTGCRDLVPDFDYPDFTCEFSWFNPDSWMEHPPFWWLTKKSQGGDISSHFTSLASRCFSGSAGDGGLSLGDGSRRCTERGEERVHRRWGAVGARAMVDWRDPRSKMVNWRGFSIIAMRKTKCCISLKSLYTHTHIYILLHIYIITYIYIYNYTVYCVYIYIYICSIQLCEYIYIYKIHIP